MPGVLAAIVLSVALGPQPVECGEWTECRQLALDAAARKDYEAFHDLAWRAVQRGPKNDPALLFMLARAQSLSGRPHDALTMLRRIAAAGVGREAVGSPEFERVRALREWPDVEALLTSAGPTAGAMPPAVVPAATPAARGNRRDAAAVTNAHADAGRPAAEALTFDAASFRPASLAYDAVSRRFIISDADVSRLAVIDEFSRQVATLASGRSAGFATVTAIAIDPRAGDLWVAGVDGSSGDEVPSLHKLQLISGRLLKRFTSESRATGRFVDIAVAGDGTVYAVQEPGRVWRLASSGGALAPARVVTHSRFASVTVSNRGVLYIVEGDGVMWLTPSDVTHLKTPDDVDLSGLARIRWVRGSLIALQRTGEGSYRVIRIRLGADGRSVTRVDVLDPEVETSNPAAVAVAGDVFYYLTRAGGGELAIRKITVR